MLLKMRRILVVVFAFIIYIALFTDTNLAAISSGQILHVYFATSALSALIFLSVGSFVWLYASDRRVALSLLGFCFALMVTFSVENRSPDDRILICLGEIGSVGAILCLSYLLIVFPSRGRQVSFSFPLMVGDVPCPWLGTCVLGISSLLGIVLVVFSIYAIFIEPHYYNLILMANYIFFVIILIVVLAHTGIFFFRSATRRERQQLFLFVWSIIIAAVPLLFLSLVPLLFNPKYVIDPRISSITMCFFPLALGYSILRYQILVFDTYVRRVVSTVAGIAFVIICVAAIVALCDQFILPHLRVAHTLHYQTYVLYLFIVSCLSASVAPFALWLARLVTERLFFREILHYQRVLNEPSLVTDEVMSVDDAASLITSAAVHTFNTSSACVFSFDEGHGLFVLYPELEEEPRDPARRTLLASLQRRIAPVASDVPHDAVLQAQLPLFERLAVARRPLLLREALRSVREYPIGVRRYLSVDSPLEGEDWLLAPLRAQGKIIGLLVLGERGDQLPYAGPDLEAAHWLLNRFSPVLEAARLYERAHQNAALLNRLYHVSMMPGYAFKTIEEAARIYTRVAAESTTATAEIWLCEDKNSVRRAAVVNAAGDFDDQASLFKQDHLTLPRMNDWQPYFFQGKDSALLSEVVLPSCLPSPPAKAFAWLPLQKDTRHLGILMIVYDGYHSFAREEMRVLEMFANQYVATLENVRMTNNLLEYNERLQEVDSLKDQFMTTASHELRTPLTTVAGYIELLNQYQGELPGEMQADFIEKARRGCDELTLLINNITDASQVSVDVEHIRLRPITLPVLIDYVLEIMETMLNSEQRQINVSLAPDVSVVADEIRLRQVLMNLLNNALKYSEEGTEIDISSQVEGQYVFITVSDHGMGIPLDEQTDIFERFMRMERDMNSPVRGAGLGLYICRQLIEAMGGQIWVESSGRVGEGSRFIFSLCKAAEPHSVEGQRYASSQSPIVAGDVMKPSVS